MKFSKTKTAMAVGAILSAGVVTSANATNLYTFTGTMNFYDAAGVLGHTDTTVTGNFDLAGTGIGTGTVSQFGSFVTTTPFFGYLWTADVDMIFSADANRDGIQDTFQMAYQWDNRTFTDIAGATYQQITCKTGATIDGCAAIDPTWSETATATLSYTYTFTNAGQMAAGTFFDWSVNDDIAVLAVFQTAPTATGFSADSVDTEGDGIPGTKMNNGPFQGQTPAFNGNMTCTSCAPPPAVPVPAAVWLFGSGLLGLVGVARRRKV